MKKKAQLSTLKRAILVLSLVTVILLVVISPINKLFGSVLDLFGDEKDSEEEKEKNGDVSQEETKYITDIICGRQYLGGSCALKSCIELDRTYVLQKDDPCPTDKPYFCCGEKVKYCTKHDGRCVRTEERCGPKEESSIGYYCAESETYSVLCCMISKDPNPPTLILTSFNEGNYIAGQTYTITWTATDEETEDNTIAINHISYQTPDGKNIIFADKLPNTGSYNWHIPGDLIGIFTIQLMATDTNFNYVTVESSDTFEIKPPPTGETT